MQIQFIETRLEFEDACPPRSSQIESHLSRWGQPLRWAITQVQGNRCTIEATVTTGHSATADAAP
ncbi:hypothetical protein [Lyngbya confervoides]|uniref:Uncharacterized protein n=1 Tax=Lyngbya confervoides BDU141951 TaxID=1574623 RepID=A0ABD4T2I8_9CYAN|nr:hypothetical protein [Lyngbya confervoides]MCM1982744.1 hypothetical protein [Lyngbya confervoides BDU141951]